jgi:hypothetical protein
MSLGSEKLGRGKKKELGLASGAEFKTNVYDKLHALTFDKDNEIVVIVDDKYLAHAVKALLEDLNFTCMVPDLTNQNVIIDKKEGIFEFRNKLDDKVKYELPYDWSLFVNEMKDSVKQNPIIKKEVGDRNMDNWNKPLDEQNTEKGDLIDQATESLKDKLKEAKKLFGLSDNDTKKNAKIWTENLYREENKTKYISKKNPDLKLYSGKYKNIQDLIQQNGWELQFEEDYGMEVFDYFMENDKDGIEKDFLSEIGFDYILDDVIIEEYGEWHTRKIEVKYKDQDKLKAEIDKKANEIIDSLDDESK